MAAVDEADFNLWLDALSDTLEIREMAIQVLQINLCVTVFVFCSTDSCEFSIGIVCVCVVLSLCVFAASFLHLSTEL